ncbi:MAG: NAD(P)/FAD-dependent oxidoreductase, partial [Oscillospiraceae bacterium]|nr:NAD(P)/FAD-dependent oxidoreductase [Oscillospiraceae bacterium]
MYDVIIVGGGVIGCAVARYLSRYNASVCLVEREEDVCSGTSKANSGLIHAGFDAPHGSLMAKYNVEGSKMMPELAKELDIPFRRNGAMVLCLNEEDVPRLEALYENGVKNGVEGLELIGPDRIHEIEPNVTDDAVAALYAPTAGVVCPFLMTVAFAENASVNGVEFKLDTEVKAVTPAAEGGWTVQTAEGVLKAKCVVNAAGVYSDVFHNMVSSGRKLHITPRRGDYCLLDHTAKDLTDCTIFQVPGKLGKGVLITPTVHGNIILGPTAVSIEDREGVNTTAAGLSELLSKAGATVKQLPANQVITSFAGLRAHEDGHEFIVGEVEDAPGFFDCAGIESPGLSSAPAIGKAVAEMLRDKLSLSEKEDFIPTRKGILDPKSLSREERNALIREQPAYGQIICRCENVTE